MTKLFQEEKTLEEIMGATNTNELTALRNQLSEVMRQSERLLHCMEKTEKQTYNNKKKNNKAKVISLLHNI